MTWGLAHIDIWFNLTKQKTHPGNLISTGKNNILSTLKRKLFGLKRDTRLSIKPHIK